MYSSMLDLPSITAATEHVLTIAGQGLGFFWLRGGEVHQVGLELRQKMSTLSIQSLRRPAAVLIEP